MRHMIMRRAFVVLMTLLLCLGFSGLASASAAAAGSEPASYATGAERDLFPVSGFQIAMAVLVVVILIAGGIALRRLSRPRTPPEPGETSKPGESLDAAGAEDELEPPDES